MEVNISFLVIYLQHCTTWCIHSDSKTPACFISSKPPQATGKHMQVSQEGGVEKWVKNREGWTRRLKFAHFGGGIQPAQRYFGHIWQHSTSMLRQPASEQTLPPSPLIFSPFEAARCTGNRAWRREKWRQQIPPLFLVQHYCFKIPYDQVLQSKAG